jgi:hypothetical protein
VTDFEAAWDELHATLPPGWVAGRPFYRDDMRMWEQYAYRLTERAVTGKWRDEWAAGGAECDHASCRMGLGVTGDGP